MQADLSSSGRRHVSRSCKSDGTSSVDPWRTNFCGVGDFERTRCLRHGPSVDEQICVSDDPAGKRLMVVYGDSHALMWLPAFLCIARSRGWKLVVLGKSACPS